MHDFFESAQKRSTKNEMTTTNGEPTSREENPKSTSKPKSSSMNTATPLMVSVALSNEFDCEQRRNPTTATTVLLVVVAKESKLCVPGSDHVSLIAWPNDYHDATDGERRQAKQSGVLNTVLQLIMSVSVTATLFFEYLVTQHFPNATNGERRVGRHRTRTCQCCG